MSDPALPDIPTDPMPPRVTLPKPVAGRIVVPGAHPDDLRGAVTLPPELLAGTSAPKTGRVRWSLTATVCVVVAIAVLIAVELIGADTGFRTFRYGVWLAVTMLVLAAIASCLPNTLWREGSLVAWNALGVTIGVLGLGVLGVSSMLALPPVLVGIALTSWPHPPATPEASEAVRGRGALSLDADQWAALVSGLLVLPLLALVEWLFLRGGQG